MAVRTISRDLADDILGTVLVGYATGLDGPLTVALSTTVPDNDGGSVTRPSGGGYTDATYDRTDHNWNFTAQRWSNSLPLMWPSPTSSWGTIRAYAVYGSLYGDVAFLWAEELATAVTPAVGAAVTFDAGTFGLSA